MLRKYISLILLLLVILLIIDCGSSIQDLNTFDAEKLHNNKSFKFFSEENNLKKGVIAPIELNVNSSNNLKETITVPYGLTNFSQSERADFIISEVIDYVVGEHSDSLEEEHLTEVNNVIYKRFKQVYGGLEIKNSSVIIGIDKSGNLNCVIGRIFPVDKIKPVNNDILEPENIADHVFDTLSCEKNSEIDFTLCNKLDLKIISVKKVLSLLNGEFYYSFVVRAARGLIPFEILLYEKSGEINMEYTINLLKNIQVDANVYKYDPQYGKIEKTALQRIVTAVDKNDIAGEFIRVRNDEPVVHKTPKTGADGSFLQYNDINANPDELSMITVYYYLDMAREHYISLGFKEDIEALFKRNNITLPSYTNLPLIALVNVAQLYYEQFSENAAYVGPIVVSNAEGYRVTMVFSGSSNRVNSPALAADVMIHEFGHYIIDSVSNIQQKVNHPDYQNKLVDNLEGGGLHEGYADYYAGSITNDFEVGEYFCGKTDKDGTPKFPGCLKKDGGGGFLRNLSEGNLKYSEPLPSELREVHKAGELWAQSMWDIREVFSQSMKEEGVKVADKLIFQSLQYLNETTYSMKQAYQGLLDADAASFTSKYRTMLLHIMEKNRGFKSMTPPDATNSLPVAKAGTDQTVDLAGTVKTFDVDCSQSYDYNNVTQEDTNSDLSYFWSLANKPVNSKIFISDPFSGKTTITPDVAGDYSFDCIVSDKNFALSATPARLTVTVTGLPLEIGTPSPSPTPTQVTPGGIIPSGQIPGGTVVINPQPTPAYGQNLNPSDDGTPEFSSTGCNISQKNSNPNFFLLVFALFLAFYLKRKLKK